MQNPKTLANNNLVLVYWYTMHIHSSMMCVWIIHSNNNEIHTNRWDIEDDDNCKKFLWWFFFFFCSILFFELFRFWFHVFVSSFWVFFSSMRLRLFFHHEIHIFFFSFILNAFDSFAKNMIFFVFRFSFSWQVMCAQRTLKIFSFFPWKRGVTNVVIFTLKTSNKKPFHSLIGTCRITLFFLMKNVFFFNLFCFSSSWSSPSATSQPFFCFCVKERLVRRFSFSTSTDCHTYSLASNDKNQFN